MLATRGRDGSGIVPLCTNVCLYRFATYRTPRLYCWQQGAGMGQGLCHFARMCACIGLQPTGLQDFIVGNKGWGWVGNCATLHQYVPAGWQPTGLFSHSLSLSFFLPSWLAQDSWPVSKAISPKWLPPMFRKLHTPKIIEHVELNLFASAEISLSQRV